MWQWDDEELKTSEGYFGCLKACRIVDHALNFLQQWEGTTLD